MGTKRTVIVRQAEHRILLIRGRRVMVDSHLAVLYGVRTEVLNQAVKRNSRRFPGDFMFRLTREEVLRSQIVISKVGRGGRRYLPYAFTEQGIAMLSSVLRSERAIQANIAIMRAFVQLRKMIRGRKGLAEKLEELERRLEGHDTQIRSLFDAIRQMVAPPEPRRRIGFRT